MKVSGRFYTPATLPPYPLDRKLSGPQSRYGRSGEETSSCSSRSPSLLPSHYT